MKLSTIKIDDIGIGKRIRQDAGNIGALAKSIDEVGLLQPIVVNQRFELVAGYRRLQALRTLGRVNVPCAIVDGLSDALKALRAENDENTCRKGMSKSEQALYYKRLKELESETASERKKATAIRAGDDNPKRKKPAVSTVTGNSRNRAPDAATRAANGAGIGDRKTAEKALTVVEAAIADPESHADTVEAMDRGELSVSAAHRKVVAGDATVDLLGRAVPQGMLQAWDAGRQVKAAQQSLATMQASITRALNTLGIADDDGERQAIGNLFRDLKNALKPFVPAVVVPQNSKAQKRWKEQGWIAQYQFEALPESVRSEWEEAA